MENEIEKAPESVWNLCYDVFSKYRSFLMGIATLSILFFHYVEDCTNAGVFPVGMFRLMELYNHYIGSGGVDMFLVLSGIGCYFSYRKQPVYGQFLKKRLIRILPTYFLIAVPIWILSDMILGGGTILTVLQDVFFVTLFTKNTILYWYILFCLVCYILFPVIYRVIEKAGTSGKERVLVLFMILAVTAAAMVIERMAPVTFERTNIMILRFPAFIFGVFLGRCVYEKREVPKVFWPISVLLLLIAYKTYSLNTYTYRYVRAVCFLVFSYWGILFWDRIDRFAVAQKFRKFVEWFGVYSLEIYLLHVTFRSCLKRIGLPTHIFRNECVMLLLTLIAVYPVWWIAGKAAALLIEKRKSKRELKQIDKPV